MNNKELKEEIRDYFKALGMAEPWDYDRLLEEYTDDIVKLITTSNKQLVDRVRSEVIGKDDILRDDEQISSMRLRIANGRLKARNHVRKEQRDKLDSLVKEMGK